MKTKLEYQSRSLVKCINTKQYLELLQEIYNYRSSKNSIMTTIKQAKQTAELFRKYIKEWELEKTCSLLPDLYVQAIADGKKKKENTDGLLTKFLNLLMEAQGKALKAKFKDSKWGTIPQ